MASKTPVLVVVASKSKPVPSQPAVVDSHREFSKELCRSIALRYGKIPDTDEMEFWAHPKQHRHPLHRSASESTAAAAVSSSQGLWGSQFQARASQGGLGCWGRAWRQPQPSTKYTSATTTTTASSSSWGTAPAVHTTTLLTALRTPTSVH